MAPTKSKTTQKKRKQEKKAPKATYRSWETTDQDEIAVRRKRAQAEALRMIPLSKQSHPFIDYQVSRTDGDDVVPYVVEIRSLTRLANSCMCPDFTKNGLGTCKHIEYVLSRPTRSRRAVESPFVEIYMTRDPAFRAAVQVPSKLHADVRAFTARYLNAMGELKSPWETTLLVLLRDLAEAEQPVQEGLRVSREVRSQALQIERRQRLALARQKIAAELRDPQTAPPIVRHRLYDYQQEGMLHLAFAGRALLADEMGLGKTVQAIAACKLLKDLENIKRVLIICPASLKTEWEEQIQKFTNLPVELVYGMKPERDKLYQTTDAFFIVTNYEQIMRDLTGINEELRPDVVILDEAQRIKNWQTKTARSIKRLKAPYAFVLTGTPLENRIDEIYSLVEFIDPHLFGSLFRFNRDFYNFDDRGRASGLKNMRELHDRLKGVMLRRRKDQIAEQLPERVDNNYFVKMSVSQAARYADYEQPVSSLLSIASRRPLTKEEMERLQMLLSCMRMICDSVYVLDQETKVAPKIDELMVILSDIWDADPTRKVIIFSEWERMLYLLAQALENKKLDYAWHTGSVAQRKRRDEINRFKDDPACLLFLSTDSGATGLNLQAASVVVNLDLPWNPAKLEQRIARAWRKHQKNSVQVINLVTENSIEHRMLSTISAKRELSEGVLDGRGEVEDLQLPNARAAFLYRLEQLVESPIAKPVVGPVEEGGGAPEASSPAPGERFAQDLTVQLGAHLLSYHAKLDGQQVQAGFIVVDGDSAKARLTIARIWATTHGGEMPSQLHVLDRQQYDLMQRLAESGAITIHDDALEKLYESDTAGQPKPDHAQRRKLVEPLLAQAGRQLKMANLLADAGFEEEAKAPLRNVADLAGRSLMLLSITELPKEVPERYSEALHQVVMTHKPLPDELLDALMAEPDAAYRERMTALLDATQDALTRLTLR